MTPHRYGALLVAGIGIGLAACTAQQQSTATAAAPAIQTLADLAASKSTTAARALADGAAICKTTSGYVALAQTLGGFTSYASVIDATAGAVQEACAIAQGVPVPLPASVPAASVPVVVLPAAAALKPAN